VRSRSTTRKPTATASATMSRRRFRSISFVTAAASRIALKSCGADAVGATHLEPTMTSIRPQRNSSQDGAPAASHACQAPPSGLVLFRSDLVEAKEARKDKCTFRRDALDVISPHPPESAASLFQSTPEAAAAYKITRPSATTAAPAPA